MAAHEAHEAGKTVFGGGNFARRCLSHDASPSFAFRRAAEPPPIRAPFFSSIRLPSSPADQRAGEVDAVLGSAQSMLRRHRRIAVDLHDVDGPLDRFLRGGDGPFPDPFGTRLQNLTVKPS